MLEERRNSATWTWTVCGLLLLATMLNYMDRQTLSQTAPDIGKELAWTKKQQGNLELAFGLAFAAGGILTGFLVDKISVRWVYPIVLTGWSLAGAATAFASPIGNFVTTMTMNLVGWEPTVSGMTSESGRTYIGLLICRTILGVFEAGQWPCALVTSRLILSQKDRTLGNSLLQSGASMGAIITPLIIQRLVEADVVGSWQRPFVVIGALGLIWLVPWFILVKPQDLAKQFDTDDGHAPAASLASTENPPAAVWDRNLVRRYFVLIAVAISINLTWHFLRFWLPTFLREFHKYEADFVNTYFTPAYFVATDIGCLSVGFATKWLTSHGWRVHRARMLTFFFCAMLTTLSVVVAQLSAGWLMLGLLLVIGFGSMGMFPPYYSLTQEISARHQGKITGTLGATTWIVTAIMHPLVGESVDKTKSYADAIFYVGLAPLVACAALALFWRETAKDDQPSET